VPRDSGRTEAGMGVGHEDASEVTTSSQDASS
jgi:hypothetical protein